MYKLKIENGYYIFKLDDMLKQKNISINQLMKDTNTDFKVLQRLMKGDLTRIDVTIISRLCDYLDVKENEILAYIHTNNENVIKEAIEKIQNICKI